MKNLEDFLKEGKKITIKRKYTENHPASTVGKTASVRNEVLKAVKDGVITEEEFSKIISKVSASPNRWRNTNSKYFNVSEDGIKLSKWGLRILRELNLPTLKAFPIHESIKVTKDKWPNAVVKYKGKKYEIEFDDYDVIDDHGNEGKDLYFMGVDQEGGNWEVDVYADYRDEVEDVHWDTLIYKGIDESAVTEKSYNKKSLMKAMKADDGMIQLGNGEEYIIYAYDNGNDDNDAMWGNDTIFALDQDGEEHEIKYSDIVSYNESTVNENYEAIFSDGVVQGKKFRNEKQALDFMKKEIASNKNLRDIAVYKPGMHSTTQTELVVKFWGDGSYLDNVSKRDKDLASKKLSEDVNESLGKAAAIGAGIGALAGASGKNKTLGQRVVGGLAGAGLGAAGGAAINKGIGAMAAKKAAGAASAITKPISSLAADKDADKKKKLLLGKNKDELTPKQKLTFDVLMKKLDGGKEHMKFKRMAKTPAQGDDLFHGYVSDLAKKTIKENVKISFHSKGAKTKWMKKQAVASKEIINQTPTSVELPSRWKDFSKKKDHDEIFSVVMEEDKKKDDKKKDKVKLKDKLDKVTKHQFTPLQKAGLGTALISLGAGTTAQNIVSANIKEEEEITELAPLAVGVAFKTATKQAAVGSKKYKNKKNEIKRKNSIEEKEEISELAPLALIPAGLGMAARYAATKGAQLAATRGGAAALKYGKQVKDFGGKSTNISRPFAKNKDGIRKKFTRGGLAMGGVSAAGTVDHLRVYGKNDKLKSQLAAKKSIRAESADVDEASAYADARRAFKKDDKRGLAPLKRDTDNSASDSDKKAANKNIIMQLRKAADLPNGAEVIFPSGTKKVDRRTAQQTLLKFNSLKKSFEKENFQKSIRSLADVKKLIGR